MAKDIPQNILSILERGAADVGRFETEQFYENTIPDLREMAMESPIEYAFYIGMQVVARINDCRDFDMEGFDVCTGGLLITPQAKFGPYRADFLIGYYGYGDPRITKVREVIVECDGTAFHERTEKERRNEKKRDRYMQKLGLKVFRFTGKEILDGPYEVAKEVIGYVTDMELDTLTPEEYFS